MHEFCIAGLLDRWILNRWIVYHEIAQPLHLLYSTLSTSDFYVNLEKAESV